MLEANRGDIEKYCRNLMRREPTDDDYARVGQPYKEMAEAYIEGRQLHDMVDHWIARSAAADELEKARDKFDYPLIESLKEQVKSGGTEQLNRIESLVKEIKEKL